MVYSNEDDFNKRPLKMVKLQEKHKRGLRDGDKASVPLLSLGYSGQRR